jgi:hypothetical protein
MSIAICIKSSIFLTLALFSWALILSSPTLTQADSLNKGVYSPESKPFGVEYEDWTAAWWQWNMGIPTALHPRDNYTSEKCSIHQEGLVWFLPDALSGTEERTCSVPFGKGILVPALTGNCDADSPSAPQSESGLFNCASEGAKFSVVSASLDGVPIKNLEGYRVNTGLFNMTVPKDNIFKNLPGTFKAVSDGFYVFLEPLAVGTHDIHITTSVLNPLNSEYNYSADVTYHIIVTA